MYMTLLQKEDFPVNRVIVHLAIKNTKRALQYSQKTSAGAAGALLHRELGG